MNYTGTRTRASCLYIACYNYTYYVLYHDDSVPNYASRRVIIINDNYNKAGTVTVTVSMTFICPSALLL